MTDANTGDLELLVLVLYKTEVYNKLLYALNDAGIVESVAGDYLVAVMSDADYDDAYFTDNEPLILNLIAALDEAHDRLLAA